MKNKLILLAALLLAGFNGLCVPHSAAEVTKPNLIIIFTDDQGYADLSCFGAKHVYTPNIDQVSDRVSGRKSQILSIAKV